jgi:hypothetical protein
MVGAATGAQQKPAAAAKQKSPAPYYCLQVHYDAGSPFSRPLFLKRHEGADAVPKDRALFAAGLPPGCSEAALSQLLAVFGDVETVVLHSSQVRCPDAVQSGFGRTRATQFDCKEHVCSA